MHADTLYPMSWLQFPDQIAKTALSTRGSAEHPMDLSVITKPDHPLVIKSCEQWLSCLELQPSQLFYTRQVHGNAVEVLTPERIAVLREQSASLAAQSAQTKNGMSSTHVLLQGLSRVTREADALITNCPGIALQVIIADCIPILLLDTRKQVAGAVHSGWRSTALNIAGTAIHAMHEHYQSDPADILVGIGPGIMPCCFHVHEDVSDQFEGLYPDEILKAQDGKSSVKLKEIIRKQCLDCGVLPQHISMDPTCSACNTDVLYSFRVEKQQCGRNAAVIMLR